MVSEFNIFHTHKSYRENTVGGPGLQWYLGDFRDLSMYVVFLAYIKYLLKTLSQNFCARFQV